MNDRFKFRFWRKHYDGTSVPEYADLMSIDGSAEPYDNGEGGAYCYCPEETICEQCTSLKDKNGKLIYEGDIVEFYSMGLLAAMGRGPMERRVGKVVWNNEYLKFDIMVEDETIPDLCIKTDDGHFVVIGNIHENPELLK